MLISVKRLIAHAYHRLDIHMKEVVSGASITFIIKIAGAAFSFGFNVLLGRMFGTTGAGLYFLALTLVTISATLGRCGLENTLLRFIAAHAAQKEWSKVKGVFQKSIQLSLTVSLLLSISLFLLTPWLSIEIFNKPDLIDPLRIMSFAVMPFSIYWLIAEGLKGLKRVRDSQLTQGLATPLLTFLGVAIVGVTGGAIEKVSLVYLTGTTITLIWTYWLWKRATSSFYKVTPSFTWQQLFKSCIPLLWLQVMYLIMNWTSLFALGIWGSKADVGIFGAAQRTAMLTSFVLMSVNSIVAPKFSALYASGDMAAMGVLARKSAKLMTIIAAPILLLFILTPQLVMGLFGRDFKGGGTLLIILAIGQFVNVVTGSVGYLLVMTGNERLMRNNAIVVAILLIILNCLLVPSLGSLGAAISTAVCMATINIGAFYLVWKHLGIWTLPIGK